MMMMMCQMTVQLKHDCFQITFEGITGSSYTGDVAIDSVQITEGDCPGKYFCTVTILNKIK